MPNGSICFYIHKHLELFQLYPFYKDPFHQLSTEHTQCENTEKGCLKVQNNASCRGANSSIKQWASE